ncbi:GPW/gp25 family protein, partial [Christensenellaceae bacterium OttesenSCG-928-M15]|nr:GPW/gp25 family protein [Christensenellaceae bacterium OttesenSCG-928-M15]
DIREAVGILLKTYVGERVMRPEFGCRAQDYVFEGASFPSYAPQELADALTLNEPRIRDVQVSFREDLGREGVMLVDVGYVVRSTNNYFNMVYPFYLMEGVEQ